jgi:hypothetical protein
MTGTYLLFNKPQLSRSYLNHLVYAWCVYTHLVLILMNYNTAGLYCEMLSLKLLYPLSMAVLWASDRVVGQLIEPNVCKQRKGGSIT